MLRSVCVSVGSVVRMPPQNARRPPGTATSAGSVMVAQPDWIGVVAPTLPSLPMTVCDRSPSLCQATCRTPSAVRSGATWSMLLPLGAVTIFQPAAWAEGATTMASAAASARDVFTR